MIKLGVNIDHVATIRNARGEGHPDIIRAAKYVINSGADIITIHRREDDRHINKNDVIKLKKKIFKPLNLEMAANFDMLKFALRIKPKYVCIVPEKRKEITTEGGLNLKNKHLKKIIKNLQLANIDVSLFIDPTLNNVKKAISLGANSIEFHTGKFSRLIRAKNIKLYKKEFIKIKNCSIFAHENKLNVKFGHGLDYDSTKYLCKIKEVCEFNIGHFIIAESVFFGLSNVIKKFKNIIK